MNTVITISKQIEEHYKSTYAIYMYSNNSSKNKLSNNYKYDSQNLCFIMEVREQ